MSKKKPTQITHSKGQRNSAIKQGKTLRSWVFQVEKNQLYSTLKNIKGDRLNKFVVFFLSIKGGEITFLSILWSVNKSPINHLDSLLTWAVLLVFSTCLCLLSWHLDGIAINREISRIEKRRSFSNNPTLSLSDLTAFFALLVFIVEAIFLVKYIILNLG